MTSLPMKTLFLIMMSNDCVQAAQLLTELHTESQMGLQSTAGMGMESLLKLQFAEPLPVVLARAKKTAKALPLHEAMKQVGHMLPSEVQSLVQESQKSHRNSTLDTTSSD